MTAIVENLGRVAGGGIYVFGGATPTVVNSVLWSNISSDGREIHQAGGSSATVDLQFDLIDSDGSSVLFSGNLVGAGAVETAVDLGLEVVPEVVVDGHDDLLLVAQGDLQIEGAADVDGVECG